MKKETVQINFDAQKLNAIKQYMGKKEADLHAELEDVVQKLYEKHVPAPVREYIESLDSEVQDKPKRPTHPNPLLITNSGGSIHT